MTANNNDFKINKQLIESIPIERYFFNTFGYLHIKHSNKIEIVDEFEKDISQSLNVPIADENNIKKVRHSNFRFSEFKSPYIYEVFYNDFILNKIKNVFEDFFILSPIESFYLNNSNIHRDQSAEINQMKILFYLDDLSTVEKGPLWVIPGTHNIYDKYSCSVGLNVQWPTPNFGNGDGFLVSGTQKGGEKNSFMEQNIPKHYLLTNKDSILMFNHNMLHGSDGNLVDKKNLRRAIGMTIIKVDRKNKDLMKKIYNLYHTYNITHDLTETYKYCEKKCSNWLNHFYDYRKDINHINKKKKSSYLADADATDKESIKQALVDGRWKSYVDHIKKTRNEIINNNLSVPYDKHTKWINDTDDNYNGL